MQVSQIAELDTHAVIGGGKAQAFRMSEKAEFFTVLSDTLYRDKKRAVVREVVCNAWDAHIMVGKTDVPVQITLTDNELVIKDFGPGIAPDRIVDIYCVYGNSTKVQDANQTGGFGLGSKAPFAYSDHFSVTSCYGGRKIVYAISRGGVETDGVPDIREMVNVPTKDTGITVTIPIRDSGDKMEFDRILFSVIRQGGMLVNLNGNIMPRWDYTESRKTGFGIIHSDDLRESSVYLLYGTVLYPVSTTDREVQSRVKEADGLTEYHAKLIIIAPPNSVGVTPSRESLSYSELTTKTVNDALAKFIKAMKAREKSAAREVVAELIKTKKRWELDNGIGGQSLTSTTKIVADLDEIARRLYKSRPDRINFNTRSRLIAAAAAKKFRDSRRLFRRVAGGYVGRYRVRHGTNFDFSKEHFWHTAKLHIRMATKLDLLDNLRVWNNDRSFHKLSECTFDEGEVQNILIVSPNQRDAMRYIKDLKENKVYRGGNEPSRRYMALILHNPTAALFEKIEEQAKHFKIELKVLKFPVKKTKSTVSAKVFHSFKQVTQQTTGYRRYVLSELPTLETAPLYIRTKGDILDLKIDRVYFQYKETLLKHYPDVAIAMNARQEAKLKSKGAKELVVQVMEDIAKLQDERDVQYAYLSANGLFVTGDRYYNKEISYCVRELSKHPTLGKLLFPDRVKLSDRSGQLNALTTILSEIAYNEKSYDRRNEMQKLRGDLDTKARKTFKHLIISDDEAEKVFRYMRPMVGVIKPKNDEIANEIADMIRFLQRRHSKSKLIDQTALKEAA